MDIPNDVLVASGVNPHMQGSLFLHAEEALEKLNQIKEADYFSDHASLATRTLERLYKGFLTVAQDESYYRIPFNSKEGKSLVDSTHNLKKLRGEITLNFPGVFPQMTRSESEAMGNKLAQYSRYSIDAMYSEFVPYETFGQILAFAQSEKEFIQNFLSKDKPFGVDDYDDV